jgi:hypothetical protein
MAIILNNVSGNIYDAYDAPMINVTVQAYDKDLRTAQLLGETVTDAKGFYMISYDATKYADSEYQTADIFIRILKDNVSLGESPVNFNVPSNFVLDFKIDNTPVRELNEFDALVQKIKPLTEPQRVAIADLQETDKFKDISFLTSETGENATKIAFLPIAFNLSGKTKIAPDIFYGLFRLQFPTDLNAILLIKSESIANGINTAIRENIISARWGPQVDSIVQTLNQLATGPILSGIDDKSAAFKQIMSVALPKSEQQETFVTVYLANEKTPEKFWETLSQQTGFTDAKVIAGIQSVLKLNLLTNYVPALTTLLYNEQQQNPALKDIRGFASYTNDDWHKRIAKLVSTGDLKIFPEGIEGTTPEEKAVSYANAITQLVKSLYPADVFADRLSKDTSNVFKETKTDLTTFFANNIDYDLKNNNIHKLFDESNLTGITDKQRLKKELTVINLLYKITDDFNQVSALHLDGIDSATVMVNKYTSTQFVEKFSDSMNPKTAAAIYQKAQQIDNRATALAMSIKMRNDIPVYAINGPTNDAPPDYESMFGDTNCDCEHCQSVYSPSAYFVDILNIMKNYNLDAYSELTTRRPDLTQILLTCKNTNTPLPYIDLVNELLEYAIAPILPVTVNGIPTYPQYQTTNSADELLAYPEHVDTAAYDRLKTATSAFNLPLDLPLEETRLYLDKLGVKRSSLMELYFGKHTDSKYNDMPIAVEYLQLSQHELNIVNGTTPMPVTLDKVTDFLRDTGLTYTEMQRLLECYFINPLINGERSIKIVSATSAQTTCKIEDLKLQTATLQSLKINPFIRLWRKTGWDILDLDRAFTALGVTDFTGDINRKLIIPLSHIARLKAQHNISVLNSITLWSNIDIAVYYDHTVEGQPKITTQYENLFLNKRVTNPVDTDFGNPGGLLGTLAAKSGIIIAALNISQKDLDTLSKAPVVDGKLTLENLSVLFRYSLLAKVLKMPVDDLISAIDLSGSNPFGTGLQSADTLTFIDKIAFIRSSGFSLPQLNSLLADSTTVLQQIDVNNIAKVLTSLREGLKKIELLDPLGATPQEQAINKLQNQNRFITDTLGAAFKTESRVINVLINSLVKSVADNTRPAITPFIDPGFIASEGPLFTINPSNEITWVLQDLFNTYVLLSNTWDRISKLVAKLKISNDEIIYFQSNEAILNISGIWNLPVSGSNLFPAFENLYNFIRLRNALASPTSDWFKLFDFIILNGVDAKKNFIEALAGLSNLTTVTIEFLLGIAANVNDTGILKFTFPSDYLNGGVLTGVINCANTADKLGSSVDNISKLIIPSPTDVQENEAAALAKSILKSKYDITTWLSIITPLSNQLRVKKKDALTSYILTSLEASMVTFRQGYLFSWDKIPGNDDGKLLEFIIKRFSIDWVRTATIEKINDGKTIRVTNGEKFLSLNLNDEKKNVNLEIDDGRTDEFIVKIENGELNIYRQDNNITDINSLYGYFLIDPEMNPCMITSRIKQAISSMQLFVDRCLMNLEAGIVLSNDFTTQWTTWRKRYRIWEANRKIFLYPENWIMPELRDDKSPFFKELESKLRQNEITDETAQDALRNYLEKLDTVANLEAVGVYPDNLTGIVHVFGRTRNIPHQYYYTKQMTAIWSAWERIDLDIEGDHLLPVVWNNRLMLFWGIFTEKQEEDSAGFDVPSAHEKIPPAPKYLEMKLAWSEYKNGKWTPKKMSKEAVSTLNKIVNSLGQVNKNIDRKQILLTSTFIDNKLYIKLLAWAEPYRKYFDKKNLDGFYFDNCNSSPSIVPNSEIPLEYFEIINNTNSNGMFLGEKDQIFKIPAGDDKLSIYDKGLCKIQISQTSDVTLFNNTPGTFQLVSNHHNIPENFFVPFFYNNEHNNFYVHSLGGFTRPPFDDITVLTQGVLISRKAILPFSPSNLPLADTSIKVVENPGAANFSVGNGVLSGLKTANFPTFPAIFIGKRYVFQTFYHPYVCDLIKTLNTSGIDSLYKNMILDTDGGLKDGIQNRVATDIFIPNGAYNPTSVVQTPYPLEQVDFNYSGMYSIYNWELFFHIPLLIATRLSQNQKFDEARKWFHYIFDPTRSSSSTTSGAERFWITNPFKEEIQKGILPIEDLINNVSPDLDLQLNNWEKNPFKPHAVARLRISAYMRTTVMKYIDNLIAWGDRLFQQNTIETINEATLLYVLAANMLGKKPQQVPARAIPEENSFSTIKDNLDSFSNAKVAIQSFFSLSDLSNAESSIDSVMMPLFCIPKNDLLLGYWDTVADRLFKIRHCLNIEGVFQQLPLFEPAINPALLVKATAAGLDLNSILNDMNVSLPNYRFQVLLQKANEFCNDVKGLGNELLAALEKKDAEQLSLIRSSHELNMLDAVRDIKVSQRDEANENLDGMNKTRDVIQARRDYYGSRELRNASESTYFNLTASANVIQGALEINSTLASIAYLIPQTNVGPFIVGIHEGGLNFGNAAMAAIEGGRSLASALKTGGELANIIGTYQRRQDDWIFQTQSADLELKQIDKQIAAAEIRLAIAEKDLENHDLQMEQSKEMDDFLNSKFTNEELYDYMVGQISSVYFQSYQLAYNTAKKAQKCFEHELGIDNTSFIQFGYWDSLKKGLLSGEKLQYDLRRLETAYLEQNRREFELTKSISLLLLDPLALIKLRETGRCFITLPEEILDLDYPGHYFRRIKSVSLTLPCIVGPYTTISCTLRLLKNSIRINTTNGDSGYPRNTDDNGLPTDDDRFVENNIPVKAIAASHAQNDSGVFELSFRDERYLPFEGAGAISEWSLELFNDNNPDFGQPLRQFDYKTISDAILHVKYTAREDAGAFKNGAVAHLRDYLSQDGTTHSLRLFNLRQEFPTQWHRFLNPTNPATGNIFELEMSLSLFRIIDSEKILKVNTILLLARCTDSGNYSVVMTPPLPVSPSDGSNSMTLARVNQYGGLHFSQKDVAALGIEVVTTDPPMKWQLKMSRPGGGNLQEDPVKKVMEVEDLILVLGYEWENS